MSSTTSDGEKPKVASRRGHLRPEEAAKLIAAAGKRGRYPERRFSVRSDPLRQALGTGLAVTPATPKDLMSA